MNLLILGGTRFVGRHMVEIAQRCGHTVTLFNRGKTGRGLFPGVETLIGDRDPQHGDGLSTLKGRTWDAVIDVSGYFPRHVRASAQLLKDHVGFYTFVSTISVYDEAACKVRGVDEDGSVIRLDDPVVEEITAETYGGLKVLCEEAVTEVYGERCVNLRPCVIVGPYDHTDRFNYWVWRAAQGGHMLVPGTPQNEMVIIDADDLAHAALHSSEYHLKGTYNIVSDVLEWGDVLETTARVAGANPTLHWAGYEYLKAHDSDQWDSMPLYIPEDGSSIGMQTISNARARDLGLEITPIDETIEKTLAWLKTRPANHDWRVGLTHDREAALLAGLKNL